MTADESTRDREQANTPNYHSLSPWQETSMGIKPMRKIIHVSHMWISLFVFHICNMKLNHNFKCLFTPSSWQHWVMGRKSPEPNEARNTPAGARYLGGIWTQKPSKIPSQGTNILMRNFLNFCQFQVYSWIFSPQFNSHNIAWVNCCFIWKRKSPKILQLPIFD